MLLVFDIGNTQIKMGAYDGQELRGSWRMTTGRTQTSDEIGVQIFMMLNRGGIKPEMIEDVLIASVVPGLNHSFRHAVEHYLNREPVFVSTEYNIVIKNETENPREVGADILMDAIAGYKLYGGPIIIVDFGTATKFVVVTGKGALIAAVICPGIGISADALVGRTAQLPSVAIQKPEKILNSNTVKCIQAGLVCGNIGQAEYINAAIKEELHAMGEDNVRVVATGGFGKVLAAEIPSVDIYDPLLTLKGMKLYAEANPEAFVEAKKRYEAKN